MPNNQEREDLNKIRHFKGSVADFKNFWDEMAGQNTNSYETPEYQGFNKVHPTRGEGKSEHWKTSNVDEAKDFKPHMMYDPETGKEYKAEKPEDHERMAKLGYVHEKPEKVDEESNSTSTKGNRLPLFEDFQG